MAGSLALAHGQMRVRRLEISLLAARQLVNAMLLLFFTHRETVSTQNILACVARILPSNRSHLRRVFR
jgi:hypothetical protein